MTPSSPSHSTLITDEIEDKAADIAYGVYHPSVHPNITGKVRAWRGPVETNPMRRAVRAALQAVEGDIIEAFGFSGHGPEES